MVSLIVFQKPNVPTGTVKQPDGEMGQRAEKGTVPVKPGRMTDKLSLRRLFRQYVQHLLALNICFLILVLVTLPAETINYPVHPGNNLIRSDV